MSNNNPFHFFDRLPDQAILTDAEIAKLAGISVDTLQRLEKRGDAPARVQLSQRRHGRQVGAVRRWLAERTVKPAAA